MQRAKTFSAHCSKFVFKLFKMCFLCVLCFILSGYASNTHSDFDIEVLLLMTKQQKCLENAQAIRRHSKQANHYVYTALWLNLFIQISSTTNTKRKFACQNVTGLVPGLKEKFIHKYHYLLIPLPGEVIQSAKHFWQNSVH